MGPNGHSGRCRVVLVDDHAMVREGLRAVVEHDPSIEVVGEAADGREGHELVGELRPDVAVIDISMPVMNGVQATRAIVRDYPGTKVIALSMHTEQHFVVAMIDAGAEGYVAKDSIAEEIVRAIRAVADGGKYFSAEVRN